jgi:hypothetical protein
MGRSYEYFTTESCEAGIRVLDRPFHSVDRLRTLPAWLVFMATLTAAMTLKLASAEALLKGFSNTGVLTVAALFPW